MDTIEAKAMAGEVAIVTGGAGGIGQRVCGALASAGARVAVCDLEDGRAKAVAARLGGGHTGFALDVRSTDHVESVVAAVTEQLGAPSVLFNGAGVQSRAPSADLDDDEGLGVLDVNLNGTWRCCRAVARSMLKAGRGAIVNVASLVGPVIGGRGRAPYGASKAAVAGLTRVLAEEWAPDGVRVNAVAPGMILTPLVTAQIDSGRLDADDFVSRVPAGRAGTPDDLLGAILLLARPDDIYLTGQTIVVDGGMTIAGPRSAA